VSDAGGGLPSASVPHLALAGLPITPLTRAQVVEHVFAAIDEARGGWIITPNVDLARLYFSDPAFAAVYANAALLCPDGVPLLWAARLQGTPLPDRVAGSDLVWLLAERAAREGRSLFLLGAGPGVAEQAAARLQQRWPALRIAGTASPRISAVPTPAEVAESRARIRTAGADLVYVALGSPKQELFIDAVRSSAPTAWWIGIGASLDFVTGGVRRAPAWMQRVGLEWLHRLAQEPRRLARRYLIEDLPFVVRLWAQAWRLRGG